MLCLALYFFSEFLVNVTIPGTSLGPLKETGLDFACKSSLEKQINWLHMLITESERCFFSINKPHYHADDLNIYLFIIAVEL